MRAWRFNAGKLTFDRAAPQPEVRPGEALVQVRAVSLASTDASPTFNGIIGREFVGSVTRINLPDDAPSTLNAKRALLGKRVVASPNVVCGVCDLCRTGLSVHCRARRTLGAWERDGALAEYAPVPLANLLEVPSHVTDEHASLAWPVASAVHAAAWVKAGNNAYVTVLGDNAQALLVAGVMARLDRAVRLLTDSPEVARVCESWGVKSRPVAEAGRRQDQDVVVDASGRAGGGLRLALQFVRPRGTVLLMEPGFVRPHPAGQPLTPDSPAACAIEAPILQVIVANEISIIGLRDGALADGLARIADGEPDLNALIGRTAPLDQAGEAITWAASHPWSRAVIKLI